jgi:hypothetical protein
MATPPETKGYTPKEIFQKIKSENQWEVDLDLEPDKIPWIYIGNIIQRTLSRMIGQGPYGPVTVKCTKEGNLAVVARGGAFDDYQRLEDSFDNVGDIVELIFSQQVERIDIFTYGGVVDYEITRDLVKAYGAKIQLFEDSFYSIDFYTRKMRATLISISGIVSGTATSTSADHLVDTSATFIAKGIAVGYVVEDMTGNAFAKITAVNSETDLTLDADIIVIDDKYKIGNPRVKLMGWFAARD